MQTKVERKKILSSGESQDVAPRSSTALRGRIPNSTMLSMMEVQERPQAQIPEAESEADRLSGSVTAGSPETVKAAMGRRMGADFSGVRFHTNAAAAARANSMGARAYTSGRDIYFGEGGFDPSVAAHELVHTAQQGMVDSSVSTMSTPAGGVQMWRSPLQVYRDYKAKKAREKEQKQYFRETAEARALEGDRGSLSDLYNNKTFYYGLRGQVGAEIQDKLNEDSEQSTPVRRADGKYDRGDVKKLVGRLTPERAQMLDPVVRDAIQNGLVDSVADVGLRKAVDDEMNHQVIAESMKLVDPDRVNKKGETDPDKLSSDEAKMAEQSGRNMAHLMFAMQLGKINITEKDGTSKGYGDGMDYDPSMASLISYGGRTHLNFGKSQWRASAEDVYRSMMELDGGNIQDKAARKERKKMAHKARTWRSFATHHLSRLVHKQNKETHGGKAAAGAFFDAGFHHRGFNPAIGGAGQVGYRSDENAPKGSQTSDGKGHVIKSDGANGHMYLGYRDSGFSQDGGMLVGLETSGAGQKNLMGKAHDASAQKAPFSATGANKTGLTGAEYNGRKVDLTGITMKEQVMLQNMLTRRMNHLSQIAGEDVNSAESKAAREQYNTMMDKLSGSKLSPTELVELIAPDVSDKEREKLIRTVTRAQGGGSH